MEESSFKLSDFDEIANILFKQSKNKISWTFYPSGNEYIGAFNGVELFRIESQEDKYTLVRIGFKDASENYIDLNAAMLEACKLIKTKPYKKYWA